MHWLLCKHVWNSQAGDGGRRVKDGVRGQPEVHSEILSQHKALGSVSPTQRWRQGINRLSTGNGLYWWPWGRQYVYCGWYVYCHCIGTFFHYRNFEASKYPSSLVGGFTGTGFEKGTCLWKLTQIYPTHTFFRKKNAYLQNFVFQRNLDPTHNLLFAGSPWLFSIEYFCYFAYLPNKSENKKDDFNIEISARNKWLIDPRT